MESPAGLLGEPVMLDIPEEAMDGEQRTPSFHPALVLIELKGVLVHRSSADLKLGDVVVILYVGCTGQDQRWLYGKKYDTRGWLPVVQ